MYKKRIITVLLACIIALTSTSAAFAAGGIGGRPANPDPDNPRTQSIFLYTLNSGDSKTDQIFLSNGGDSEETVRLYTVDGVATNTGSYTCEQESEERDGVGSWVYLSKSEITLPAKATMNLDFTVTVPEGADVGEHNGCIAIQKRDDPGEVTGNLRIHTRQAVRMAIVVPGDIHRKVEIESFEATSHLNGQDYEVILKNSGNVSADVDLKLRLKDVFGNTVYMNGGQQPVLANKSLQLNYQGEYRPFFGGWYIASVDIAYDKRAGVYGTLNPSELLRASGPNIIVFVWPSIWFFIILGILAVLTTGYLVGRRRTTYGLRKKGKKTSK
ncbi:MAG TPA: DUF916 domain-containing protein [Candidatus Saccharibacteria bacterium]|nr:DUF916 domain-containing protein [Candidatus Saccharibacteria bacterium]